MSRSEPGDWPNPVPAYVLTGGRVVPSQPWLRPETLLTALLGVPVPDTTGAAHRRLLTLCHQQLSVAETAVGLGLPLSVVRVLASDLIDEGLLATRAADPHHEMLERILAGLQQL
jgi:hypothetical protein